jgi:glucose/arabinose dehydrogenase
MFKYRIMVLLLAGLALAACGSNQVNTPAAPQDPALENTLPPEVALNVQNFIIESMPGLTAETIEIKNVEQQDWPDGCLGLPEGDEACVEAITPGWLLTFNIDGQEYRYRVDQTGTVIRQEP